MGKISYSKAFKNECVRIDTIRQIGFFVQSHTHNSTKQNIQFTLRSNDLSRANIYWFSIASRELGPGNNIGSMACSSVHWLTTSNLNYQLYCLLLTSTNKIPKLGGTEILEKKKIRESSFAMVYSVLRLQYKKKVLNESI
ncbi:hypothetical protein BpHYR1_046989 [Brachionus plicatilis]|uniref:Uncharacterized protein n=1 Tax=Brachionus plicatilis TaxID=10195 RepID=A0A3M7SDC5_BRAPC|nr:hypothetical protein BpHYR1_046989 [Brachionus plicatilis]